MIIKDSQLEWMFKMKSKKNDVLFNKTYYENYAKSTLQHIINCSNNSFINSDKPDLQSEKLNIGIEVTRAVAKEYGRIQSITNKYFGKDYSGQYLRGKINKIIGYDLIHTVGGMAYWMYNFTEKETEDLILKAINLKSQKLNSGYRVFGKNYLYIFINNSMIEEDTLMHIISEYRNMSFRIKFDKIIINAIDKAYIVSDSVKSIFFNDGDLNNFKQSVNILNKK